MKKIIAILLLSCVHALAQISGAGNIGCSGATITGTPVTSGTSNNAVLFTGSNAPVWGYSVQLTQTTTVTAGAISFKASNDGGATFTAIPVAQVLNTSTFVQLTNPYTLVASTNQSFLIIMDGASNFEVQLTTTMTGSGTITPSVTAICTAPFIFQDLRTLGGTAIDTNSGSKSAGTLRIVIATDQPQLTNALKVDGSAVTQPISGEAAGVATASTTNSGLGCYLVSAASTNSTSCKGSAGNLYGIRFINTTATIYYLRLYNSASAPTCSSATGFIESIPIPASTSGAGLSWTPVVPIGYSTGIGFCFTGGSSSTDNTNAATGVFGVIQYK